MRWKEITEAPIADFGTYGDMSQEGSFRSNDIKAMTNPKWQAKLHRMFERTEFPINLYLINAPNDIHTPAFMGSPAMSRSGYRDVGNLRNWAGIRSKDDIEQLLDRKFTPAEYEQAITVCLIENEGDERIPLTPWMVAHRISHAFLLEHDRNKYYDIANLVSGLFSKWNAFIEVAHTRLEQSSADYSDMYEKFRETKYGQAKFHAVSAYLGQTKGMKNLSNAGEFLVESFAQFLIQGKVSYNRPEVPGHERRRPLTKEERDFIQDSVREYFHGDVDTYVQKRFPAPQKPRSGYVAFDADGVGVASFGADRVEHYKSQGLTVKERKPSWQAKKKYTDWEAKVAEVREMWERLESEGFMEDPYNRTEMLDSNSEEFEKFLNSQFRAIMVRCIGKFLVL